MNNFIFDWKQWTNIYNTLSMSIFISAVLFDRSMLSVTLELLNIFKMKIPYFNKMEISRLN